MGVGGALGLAGGALGYLGQKEAAKSGKSAAKSAEHARREAVQFTQPQQIYQMADWLFPGAVRNPNTSFANPSNSLAGTPGYSGGAGGGKPHLGDGGKKSLGVGMAIGGLLPGLAALWYMNQKKSKAGNSMFPGFPGKQFGGPVQAGQPYTVGEDGPETMVPTQPGVVIPNPGTPVPLPGVQEFNPEATSGGAGAPGPMGGGGGFLQKLFQNWMSNKQGKQQPSPQNFQPTSTVQGPDLGTLSVQHAQNFLQNPGELSTIQYERDQEQANQGLNANVQGLMGSLTGMGISPRSGLGQTAFQGAFNENTRARSLAARDMALQQEALKRTDIAAGLTAYQNFLNQVFGIVGTQAGAAGGGSFPQVPAINPYENLSQAISVGGSLLADNKSGGGKTPSSPYPESQT